MSGRVRLTGGSAGGLFLRVPDRFPSRPTQDRVRAALFSSLGERIVDARVVDLFSGTGALGIEALSRGAASCTFVESEKRCAETIKENLRHCRLEGRVLPLDSARFLRDCAADTEARFDVILLDPPYSGSPSDLALTPWLPDLLTCLAPGGIIVWEHSARDRWDQPAGLEIRKQKRYGDSTLTSLVRAGD